MQPSEMVREDENTLLVLTPIIISGLPESVDDAVICAQCSEY